MALIILHAKTVRLHTEITKQYVVGIMTNLVYQVFFVTVDEELILQIKEYCTNWIDSKTVHTD